MPKVRLELPSSARPLLDGARFVDVEAATVGEALARFSVQYPQARRLIFRVDGQVRESTAVFVNARDVAREEVTARRLEEGDVVTIVPAISGGAEDVGRAGAIPVEAEPEKLTLEEIRRYSRHLLLPEVGLAGQRRLRGAKVLLVGAGGLGSPAALYLAAAGVGTLGVVESDVVDLSNLQRQVLYRNADVGQPKLERARETVHALNPSVEVRAHPTRLDSTNALEIIRDYEVVVDGSDNFPTRYLVNDACVLLEKPDVYGSVYRFEGQATVFDARHGPCYRCLFPEPPPAGFVPNCAEGGVLGVLPGLIGEIQATETLKLLLGIGEPLIGRLLMYDALEMRFRELAVQRDLGCVISGTHPSQVGLIDYPAFCGVDEAGEAAESGVPGISAEQLAERLAEPDPPLLLDVRQPGEWALGHLPGAKLIPRADLAERVDELSGAREIVVYCSAGSRSAQATRLLTELGIQRVRHLEGGLRAWSEKVDPSMPQY
ncbi:MAG TPA: molybdopterin-synthase adenylyltransferase MoeB [Thermoplasmata archaeon]|nr:molybdopterin-synthase adenylyltransferase MoeB [Thermoplasmata archaeon]